MLNLPSSFRKYFNDFLLKYASFQEAANIDKIQEYTSSYLHFTVKIWAYSGFNYCYFDPFNELGNQTYWMQSIMRITKWYSLPSLILFIQFAIKSSFGLCSGLGQTREILTCPAYSGHKQFNKFQMIYFPSFERELRYNQDPKYW